MSTTLRTCTTLYGRQIALPRERFVVRPSVYAVIVHNGAVLLVTNTHTGRYVLPGAAVDPGESLGEALRREVWEETGIAITDLQTMQRRRRLLVRRPDRHGLPRAAVPLHRQGTVAGAA